MSQTLLIASSFVLAILTFFLAKYTRTLAIEAKNSREVQTQPHVIVTAIHDLSRPTLIMLSIKNIGHGMAKDVYFETSKPLMIAFGLDEKTTKPPTPVESGPFKTGIPSLGPGESRVMNWGQCYGLTKVYGIDGIKITCHFSHGTKRLPPTESIVEVESFANTIAHSNPELRSANALEEIANTLKKANSIPT